MMTINHPPKRARPSQKTDGRKTIECRMELVLAIRGSWGAEPSGLVAARNKGDHQMIVLPDRSAPRR